MSEPNLQSPERVARALGMVYGIVLVGAFLGLIWKVSFFRFADSVYGSIVIRDSFFPVVMQEAITLRIAYLTCLAAIAATLIAARWRRVRTAFSIVALGAGTILMLHQGSYNDMTFVTVWWCLVFALWYSGRWGIDPDGVLLRKAAFLSRVIVSMVLLGGAVGKWTSEYWSGQVLYEIYFVDRNFWTFNWLRDRLDATQLRDFATLYSRFIVGMESIGSLIWLLPPRLAGVAGAAVFLAIGLLSNYSLFSVLTPLIGLASVGLLVPQRKSPG